MDTIDHSAANLPAPFQGSKPSFPALAPAFPSELVPVPTAAQPKINLKTIMRGLLRHWWHILVLWILIAGPIIAAIQQFVEPTYEAFSTLQIEPTKRDLFGPTLPGNSDYRSVAPYLNTQAQLITSDRVLNKALSDHSVSELPWLAASADPTVSLREEMVVETVADAFLIRVALELPDGNQAAAIVNAVVRSYMDFNTDYERGTHKNQKVDMSARLASVTSEIKNRTVDLKTLTQKGTVDAPRASELSRPSTATDDGGTTPTFSRLADQHVQAMISDMVKTDIELLEAQASLDIQEKRAAALAEAHSQPKQDDSQLEAEIRDEFQKDPAVIALTGDIQKTEDELERVKAKARLGHDPARRAAQQQLKSLNDDYVTLWHQKHKEISARLKADLGGTASHDSIGDLRMKVETLKNKKEEEKKLFAALQIDSKTSNIDNFEATFLKLEISGLLRKQEQIRTNLEQLEFEASQELYRIEQRDKAVSPKSPTNNKKIKYLVFAPFGALFMVLGTFFLLEIKAERVADPESLSTRVGSEVYAIPPYPTAREGRRLGAPKIQEQYLQFVQRLDHLRFAVCGNSAELGKGRCMLVTSAISGEGKTTLAAHLAGRCGHAGLSTLLIDADTCRAKLSELLEIPESPGLTDVLNDEATLAQVVRGVHDNLFYLLPAGVAVESNARLLQGPRLATLITELRQLYDIIIIDSPPVLPVPDALILGQWADGAVLASRYDISRFSQVERARRQLDNAGIAILGTVINGVRNAESYYGRYANKRRPVPQSNPGDAS